MPDNEYCQEPSNHLVTSDTGVYFSKCDLTAPNYVEPSKDVAYEDTYDELDYSITGLSKDLPSEETYDDLEFSSTDNGDSSPNVKISVPKVKAVVSSRQISYIVSGVFLSIAVISISIYGFIHLGQDEGKCEIILIHGNEKLKFIFILHCYSKFND